MNIRNPAVAGLFYPNDPQRLKDLVVGMLMQSGAGEKQPAPLKGLIVPHAGYVYSGPVAANAYKLLAPIARRIGRVVLLGPSHRVPLRGIAASNADAFRTPLGLVEVDQQAIELVTQLPGVSRRDDAHAQEHSLEVHLPFLQVVLGEWFKLVPLVVGLTEPETVANVLSALWGGEETLIVVSSDLSHYLPYETAQQKDSLTTECIVSLQPVLTGAMSCGCYPLNGLLKLAAERGMSIRTLDVRNSGDTAGTRDKVVGYGSYALSS